MAVIDSAGAILQNTRERGENSDLKLKKARRLKYGETVGVISPASPPWESTAVDECVAGIQRLGFRPKLGRFARESLGFLAGTDAQRAQDVNAMFRDPEVKAIFCVRGGYGTARILDRLDYALIRQNPKPLIGFSDITSLHCAMLNQGGVVAFHGPNVHGALTRPGREFTVEAMRRAVMMPGPVGDICSDRADLRAAIVPIRGGKAKGPLVGGNLTVLNTMLGTRYQPTFENRILFLEEVDEAPYRVDRALTFLLNLGVLQQVAGVVVGLCNGCVAKTQRSSEQSLLDVLRDRLGGLGKPVIANAPFGHVASNATLPVGVEATLDADCGILSVDESGVV